MANYDDLFMPSNADNAFDKEVWVAQKQQEREAIYHRIAAYVQAMNGDGKRFQTYLDVQAKFDRYSVSNAILIADQMPQATYLADFESWKQNGVYVRKGAVGISILEPGKEYEKTDGSTGVSYNVKKVFDISQTNSRQKFTPSISRDERLLLKALMNTFPGSFQISNGLPDHTNAMYSVKEDTIFVRQGLSAFDIFRSIAGEMVHANLHKGGYKCQSPDFVAYSAAYLLCKRNGVSVQDFSFERIPSQYHSIEEKEIRSEMSTIREIAGEISTSMNRFFEVQERRNKHRDVGVR